MRWLRRRLMAQFCPGITRDSVLQMLRAWGITVSERLISIEEVVNGCRSGELIEMFASGTAAVISPVAKFTTKEKISR